VSVVPKPIAMPALTRRAILIVSSASVAAVFVATRFAAAQSTITLLDNLHWTIAFIAAAVLGWMGIGSATEAEHLARRWFAIGLTAAAAGQLVWDLQVFFGKQTIPVPSDFFYLWLGPCIVVGVWRTLRSHASEWRARCLVLDAIALTTAAIAVTLALYLPMQGNATWLQVMILAAYPISFFSAAGTALVLVPALGWRPQMGWMIFIAAILAGAVAWMRFNALSLVAPAPAGTWLNLSFSIAILALGASVAWWRVERWEHPQWLRACERFLLLLPLFVVAVAVISVAIVWTLPRIEVIAKISIAIGAAIVIVTAALRQNLLLAQREQLLAAERRVIDTLRECHVVAERLSLATEAAKLGIWDLDLRSNQVVWDARMYQLYGTDPTRFNGSHEQWESYLHPDDLPGLREDFRDALAHKREFSRSFRIITGTGELRYLEGYGLVQHDQFGVPVRVTGITWDTTEHVKAQQALVSSEAELRAIFDNAAIGMVLVNSQGKILRRNPAYLRFLGYTADELVTQEIGSVTYKEDLAETLARFEALVRGERDHEQMEKRYIHRSGATIWGRITASVVQRGGDQKVILAMVEDITTRKSAEAALNVLRARELQAREEFAHHLMAAKEQERKRIANELHDGVGQSLSLIKNSTYLALEQAELPIQIKERLNGIQRITSTAIAEVRGLARNLRPLHIEQQGVTEALRELLRQFVESSNIELSSHVEDIDDIFDGDQVTHIYRLVQEALTNIVKHSHAKHVVVTVSRDIHHVSLQVNDDGQGFDRARVASNHGLGLTSITERAHMLGGMALIESAAGEGTRLRVELPITDHRDTQIVSEEIEDTNDEHGRTNTAP